MVLEGIHVVAEGQLGFVVHIEFCIFKIYVVFCETFQFRENYGSIITLIYLLILLFIKVGKIRQSFRPVDLNPSFNKIVNPGKRRSILHFKSLELENLRMSFFK